MRQRDNELRRALSRILEKYSATPDRAKKDVIPYHERPNKPKKKDDIPDHMKGMGDEGFSEMIVHPDGWKEKRSKRHWTVLRPRSSTPRRKCNTCGRYD